jgi:hypothetical protein
VANNKKEGILVSTPPSQPNIGDDPNKLNTLLLDIFNPNYVAINKSDNIFVPQNFDKPKIYLDWALVKVKIKKLNKFKLKSYIIFTVRHHPFKRFECVYVPVCCQTIANGLV